MKIIQCIQSKALAITMIAMSFVIMVLAALNFYLLVPHVQLHKSQQESEQITRTMITTSNVDVALYWNIYLEKNEEKLITTSLKSNADTQFINAYTEQISSLKLTTLLSQLELFNLVNGSRTCGPIRSDVAAPQVLKTFATMYPNNWQCIIPQRSQNQLVTGQMTIIWKIKPTDEQFESVVIQAKDILRTP